MKKYILFTLMVILTITTLSSCNQEVIITSNTSETNQITSEYIYIDIKGEVLLPGVYLVKSNYLIKDVIDLAGGLSVNADISNINLAQNITSNQMIVIPSNITNSDQQDKNDLININKASKNELMNLPSIGESKANNIISYRNTKGPFKSIEEIKLVSGIGNEVYNKIKDLITV